MNAPWQVTVARVVLGLIFTTAAVNYFCDVLLGWPPFHPAITEPAKQLAGAIMAAGYLWPLMKLINLTAGTLLLLNRVPAFAVALLIPITVVIVWFQFTLNPLPVPLMTVALVVACEMLLVRAYARCYAGMFQRRRES